MNTTDIPSALHGTDGQFLGTTISSFNSVSLALPLVLFSMARSALSLDLWRRAERYGVTVLAEHQTELSNRFARASVDKSKDLRLQVMENGSPLLPNWLAYFECEPYARYDGGDHEIFVGGVLAFRCQPQPRTNRALGLSISRSIVELHGGRLSASPVQPYGSVFQVMLPATS